MHAGIAVALLWQSPSPGARSAGIGGIEVSLVLAGSAPGAPEAETTAPSEAATERPAETVSATPPDSMTLQPVTPAEAGTVTPVERPSEVPPVEADEIPWATEAPEPRPIEEVDRVEMTEAVPVEEVDAIEAAKAVPVEKIDAVEAPEAMLVEEVETVQRTPSVQDIRVQRPDPAAKAKPEDPVAAAQMVMVVPPPPKPKPRLPERPRAEAKPKPRPEPAREMPQEAVQAAESMREQGKAHESAVAPSAPVGGGKAGTRAGPSTGGAGDTTGGGRPGDAVDYMAVLQAWLEKYKEYPRRAQLRRQEGTVLLYFIMDRKGRVLDYRIRRSSGHALLDRAAAEMIERAQPLPRMPDAMHQARLELVVPVQFLLR